MSVKAVGMSSQGSFHRIFSSGKIRAQYFALMLLALSASFAPQYARSEEMPQILNTESVIAQRPRSTHSLTPSLATAAAPVGAANLPAGTVGVPYSGSVAATGGVAPYKFSVTAGALPAGLSLNTTDGQVSGTPTTAITKSFWVKITDSQGSSGKLHTQITIAAAATQANITVAVSPSNLSLASSGSQQFSATVQGTSNTAVTWSTSAGTISSTGLFTAPAVTSNTSVTVTAKSVADPSQSASAYVTVDAAATPVTISLSPTSATLASGTTKQFTATVQGTTNTAVTWSASAGSVSSAGVFTAPVVSSNISVNVVATSAADSTKYAVASVSVTAPVAVTVSISPSSTSVASAGTMQFAAVVQGASNTAVNWSASAGTISTSGLFTAPSVSTSTSVSVTATSAADAAQSASASVSVSAVSSPTYNTGCGVGAGGTDVADQTTCGNYSGAPYEDLETASPTTPPTPFGAGSVHLISGCTTITATEGDIWRFSADVNDGVGGTNQNCIWFRGEAGNDFVIDLAGHTLTGGIKCDQSVGGNDCSGMTIVNGTVNCDIATGSAVSCITLTLGENPSKSILLSHLTVNNFNSPSRPDGTYSSYQFAILTQTGGTTIMGAVPAGAVQKTFNGAGVEEAHLTVADAAGYTGAGYTGQWCARCTAIFNGGAGGGTVEAWSNSIPNNPYVDANQGIVFYHTGPASAHNNYFPWVAYKGTADTGRPILFDSAGKQFDQAGGQVFNNLIETYNNRCVRTRQVNNVLVHDNRFEHVESTIVDPCIMMGGNGDYSEKIDGNVVSNNTFVHAGGNSIEAAESYGLVAEANTFVCESNCSSGTLTAAWIAEGGNGLTYAISSASRTAACVVTLHLAYGPAATSVLNGSVYVNVSGRSDDFNVSGTAGNLVTTVSGSTVTYTQAGCVGANTGGASGIFWMAQSKVDNFPANGAEIYVKNSIVDPQLTMSMPFVACGSASPACQNAPQLTQIKWCNNTRDTDLVPALGGTGAIVSHLTPDSACP